MENPHQTNKAQVGLSNVRNLPTSLTPDAIAGTSDNSYMTPLSTKAALDAALTTLRAHVAITAGNPHGTTAHDVDAYTRAEVDSALAGKLSAGQAAADTLLFDGKTAVEYREWVQSTSAASNAQRFEGKTYQEARADILSGKAADSERFNGMDQTQLANWVDARLTSGGNYAVQFGKNAHIFQDGTGKVWTKLGDLDYSSDPAARARMTETHWLISGGEKLGSSDSPMLYVRLSPREAGSPMTIQAISLNGYIPNARFGYVVNTVDGLLEIWMETDNDRSRVTATYLGGEDGTQLEDEDLVSDVAPAGIVYSTNAIDTYAMRSEIETMLQAMTTKFTQLAQAVSQ